MPEFQVPPIEVTPAEQAVHHVLTRVSRDANFRHYMLHTESLAKCVAADAARLGITAEARQTQLEAEIEDWRLWLRQHSADIPDVVSLRFQVHQLVDNAADDETLRVDADEYYVLLAKFDKLSLSLRGALEALFRAGTGRLDYECYEYLLETLETGRAPRRIIATQLKRVQT
jgi:hypothetical protein